MYEAIGLLQLVTDGTDPDCRRVKESPQRIKKHFYTVRGMKNALEVSVALVEKNMDNSPENKKLGHSHYFYAAVTKETCVDSLPNQYPKWKVLKFNANIKKKNPSQKIRDFRRKSSYWMR